MQCVPCEYPHSAQRPSLPVATVAASPMHGSHWWRHPVAGTWWQSDTPPGDRSRTGTPRSDRVRRSVSPDLEFSMWRRGLHAKGGIHKLARPSKSQPARQCSSAQARPSKMPSIRRLRRGPRGRRLHHQRNPRCGSKRPIDLWERWDRANTLAIPRGASSGTVFLRRLAIPFDAPSWCEPAGSGAAFWD